MQEKEMKTETETLPRILEKEMKKYDVQNKPHVGAAVPCVMSEILREMRP
jgi:hypothetical protein